MNYRHAFHAGGFTDVVKHAIIALIVESLKRKETPFYVLDTHAGIGSYDLTAPQALRTSEWRAGIGRVLAATETPVELGPYLDCVRALNAGQERAPRFYPGSPRLIRTLLRRQDRLVACELHQEDSQTLADEFRGDRRVKVHALDGYLALKAFLPPKERRGLVLVDPPFEEKDEFTRLARGLIEAHRRWATGIYALWYPIKDRLPIAAFHGEITASGLRRVLAIEFLIHPPVEPERLNGCGLVIVNAPFGLVPALENLLPWLRGVLASGNEARCGVDWLVAE